MNHYHPKSKGTWGKEDPKSSEELNRLCNEFFDNLKVPDKWKWIAWDNAIDPQLGLISVGKAFRDMRTSGIDLMHYRVYFNSFSCKGGICSKTIIDFGKYKYSSVVGNKTVEQLNEWIAEKYTSPPTPLLEERGDEKTKGYDENDGLQHFRDRFGT